MFRLQRAAAAAHHRGQSLEAFRAWAAVLVALSGVALTASGRGSSAMAVIGLVWFAISFFLLRRLACDSARSGALIQEQFDTTLFYLPWRFEVGGDRIADHDISRLARRLKADSPQEQRILDGWYDSTAGMHHPYDVLVAQEQNLVWDTRLRRRYAHTISIVAIAWTFLGVAVGAIVGASITTTVLTFYVPSLAAYTLAAEIWVGQMSVASERERLSKQVASELARAQQGPIPSEEWERLRNVARNIQDGILRTRFDVSRVPEWFYSHFRDADERDFGYATESHRRRLSGAP